MRVSRFFYGKTLPVFCHIFVLEYTFVATLPRDVNEYCTMGVNRLYFVGFGVLLYMGETRSQIPAPSTPFLIEVQFVHVIVRFDHRRRNQGTYMLSHEAMDNVILKYSCANR